MYCKSCGAAMEEDSNFCKACGAMQEGGEQKDSLPMRILKGTVKTVGKVGAVAVSVVVPIVIQAVVEDATPKVKKSIKQYNKSKKRKK